MKVLQLTNRNVDSITAQVQRSQQTDPKVLRSVQNSIAMVRKGGDQALKALTKRFDNVSLTSLNVSRSEIQRAYALESVEVIQALKIARQNIEQFHKSTIPAAEKGVATQAGVKVWREFRPIERVGLYVPGGTAAYPSTVLMLGVPARLAQCTEVILCVPPSRDGTVPSAVLVAADLCGITNIFKVGGAQAIAAMAYGTESIPGVSKIFGPGNAYVTEAKRSVYGSVDIDMPAGPSEILVYADRTAQASWVAADLLSQLEHGPDSQAILVTESRNLALQVVQEVERQRRSLPRRAIIAQSLKQSYVLITDTRTTALNFINAYAPEHIELVVTNPRALLPRICNAGSVFLGPYASEPLGDYATGANHTLPTSGAAKMFSGLSVESFGKKIQVQTVTRAGIKNLRTTVETLASREGLTAHKNAIRIRFQPLWKTQKTYSSNRSKGAPRQENRSLSRFKKKVG